jgi:putative protease
MDGMTTLHEQLYNMRSEEAKQDFIGLVLDYDPTTYVATIEQRNKFAVGDEVEVFRPSYDKLKFRIEAIEDEQGDPIEVAPHPRQLLRIPIPFPVSPYDMLRKITTD